MVLIPYNAFHCLIGPCPTACCEFASESYKLEIFRTQYALISNYEIHAGNVPLHQPPESCASRNSVPHRLWLHHLCPWLLHCYDPACLAEQHPCLQVNTVNRLMDGSITTAGAKRSLRLCNPVP